jgi:hypothetical protein
MNNYISNGRSRVIVPQFINTTMVLRMVKERWTFVTLSKPERKVLIRSAIELTEFKGLQLRRWIREVLFFTSIV